MSHLWTFFVYFSPYHLLATNSECDLFSFFFKYLSVNWILMDPFGGSLLIPFLSPCSQCRISSELPSLVLNSHTLNSYILHPMWSDSPLCGIMAAKPHLQLICWNIHLESLWKDAYPSLWCEKTYSCFIHCEIFSPLVCFCKCYMHVLKKNKTFLFCPFFGTFTVSFLIMVQFRKG